MTEPLLAAASALWLGVLTSASPCPLATNVAAVAFIGRQAGGARRAALAGLAYALGRMAAYAALAAILIAGLLAAHRTSYGLQVYLNQAIGPLLVLVGMALVGLLPVPLAGSSFAARFGERLGGGGIAGALAMGALFALAFCPVSAALFFGGLLPLATATDSPLLLPALYGAGTALPAAVFAVLLAAGVRSIGSAFDRIAAVERWLRLATGVVIIAAGVWITLGNVFGISLTVYA